MGVHDVHAEARVEPDFNYSTLTDLLRSRGVAVETLDLYDERADHRLDLNEPIPTRLHGRFGVLLDIGTAEHVFDTRQAFANYFSLVNPAGYLCLHLPVAGYYRHGLHTFSPELIRGVLDVNGCRVVRELFSDHRGNELREDDLRGHDALMWVVARRAREFPEFRAPQQAGWGEYYRVTQRWP